MDRRRHLKHFIIAAFATALAPSVFAAALPPIGNWQGHYRCAQGDTALDLEISATTPFKVDAVFYFHALTGASYVPQGCFMMHGLFNGNTHTILLHPAAWLDHPASYVSVGLRGTISASGQTIQGTISGPACTTFSLTRSFTEPVPAAPAPCRTRQQGPVV